MVSNRLFFCEWGINDKGASLWQAPKQGIDQSGTKPAEDSAAEVRVLEAHQGCNGSLLPGGLGRYDISHL